MSGAFTDEIRQSLQEASAPTMLATAQAALRRGATSDELYNELLSSLPQREEEFGDDEIEPVRELMDALGGAGPVQVRKSLADVPAEVAA